MEHGKAYRVKDDAKFQNGDTQYLRRSRFGFTRIRVLLIDGRSGRLNKPFHPELRHSHRLVLTMMIRRNRLDIPMRPMRAMRAVQPVVPRWDVGAFHRDTLFGEVGCSETNGDQLEDEGEEEGREADPKLRGFTQLPLQSAFRYVKGRDKWFDLRRKGS